VPSGTRKNPAGAGEFILPAGTVLTSFGPTFLPEMGYVDGVGVDPERTPEPKRVGPSDWKKVTKTAFGTGGHTTVRATIRVPEDYRANMPGVCVADNVADGVRTMRWETDHPVMAVNVVAGRWQESRGKSTVIWHLPEHGFNVPVMLEALDGAHEWYSKWFWPYPWKELRLSEFPGLAGYAQGFPTNITFSETIGFMSRPTPEEDTPFMVTAHEAAHQWFGNILRPGIDPGGNILSEGMAHYSSARLIRQVRGERMRMAFMRNLEFQYGVQRSADDELPMTETDGSRSGDQTVTYDKGGWVFWMLMEHMGEERMDAAMRDFIGAFKDGPDFPLLQDLVEALRPHAPDAAAYDAFTKQWFYDVVVPEFKVESATVTAPAKDGDPWRTVITVRNANTATVPLEVAVTNGEERWPDASICRTPKERAAAATQRPEYRDARARGTISAGETIALTIESDFKPTKAVVDPDVRTLMLNRKLAERDL
jgi:aminopeptidase N